MEIYTESNVSQPPKKSARLRCRPDRSIPAFAGGQREAILKMLRTAGPHGVSKEILLFEKHWSQAAARIFELEQQGYRIKHVQVEGEKYVRYVLEGEPENPKPLPTYQPKGPDKRQGELSNSPDWYSRTTGRDRPQDSAPGPLFERTASR
jgi:hypothetical protein